MSDSTIKDISRRDFFCASRAVTGIGLIYEALFGAYGNAQQPVIPGVFQLVRAQTIRDSIEALRMRPGNESLVDSTTLPITIAVEVGYSEKQFEWHDDHDHLFQILEGSTVYEIGGTPINGRSIGPGEWRAPGSEGAIVVKLNKGDMLVIPRGTPHRQSTPETVSFILISPAGG